MHAYYEYKAVGAIVAVVVNSVTRDWCNACARVLRSQRLGLLWVPVYYATVGAIPAPLHARCPG